MLPLLLLLFIAVPIAELYVIIQVGEWIGALPTIALLIADSVLGAALVRAQGRAAWRRLLEAINAGRVPGREVLDGSLVLMGGMLLLAPGFISDVFGVLLLLPPTRALGRRLLARRVLGRMVYTVGSRTQRAPRRDGGAGDYDIEGTAVDVDAARRPDEGLRDGSADAPSEGQTRRLEEGT